MGSMIAVAKLAAGGSIRGVPVLENRIQKFLAVASLVLVCRLAFAASPIYVDQNATGANDGSSWENALTNLASAISWGSTSSREVWVARGTYVLTNSNGVQLGNNIRLYGGFAGTEIELAQRDWAANPTILTGTGSNRILMFNSNSHIDGFTLTGGNSTYGGAIFWNGTPSNCTITNCVFESNTGTWGAAVRVSGSDHVFRNCVFRDHAKTAVDIAGSADFIDCVFENNVRELDAHSGSLAMYINGSSSSGHKTVNLIRCMFAGNHGKFAAVLTSYAGALVTAINCIFTGNSAEFDGGAVEVSNATFTAINSVFYGNSARNGGAIYIMGSGCEVDIVNSIFFNNNASISNDNIHDPYNAVVSVTYSLIDQAKFSGGAGNITGDPLFVDPDGADNIPGTADDDFRLQAGSPCIDAGFDDGGLTVPATDFLGRGRFDDPATTNFGTGPIDFVDIGAFEVDGVDACLSLLIHGTATVPETAGAAVRASLSIPTALASDLLVELASSNIDKATVPASVTIPAGQTWASIRVTPVDDGAIGGDHAVVITASAAGFAGASGTITVLDTATKTVSVILPASVSESAISVTGTVMIPGTWHEALVVTLASDSTRLTIPATATIPQGETSVEFAITPIDNGAIDGDATVTITASADGWTGGSAEIEVLDDESQTITIELSHDQVTEDFAGQVTGTVTIPGTWHEALVVSISSNNPARLTVPATVTIPQGDTSAEFDVTIINNTAIDGDVTVAVTASAYGWAGDSATIEVLDDEPQAITIELSHDEVAVSFAGEITGTVTIPGTWHEDLVINLTSSDPAILTVPATVTIDAGETSAIFAISIAESATVTEPETVTISASADGWAGDSAEIILTKAAKSSGGCAAGTGNASAFFGLLGLALMTRRR